MSALGRSGREGGGTPRSVASSTATGAADLECICAICTCGKHRCPPAPAPRIPFTGETSYGREFVEHPICRVHCAPAQTYQRVSLPFDGTTTYKAEYHEWPLEKHRADGAMRGPGVTPVRVPFEGSTTNADTYREWPLDAARPPTRDGGATLSRTSLPFEGRTTAQDAYVAHPLPARGAAGERGGAGAQLERASVPFDGRTTTQDSYKAWPIEARAHVAAPTWSTHADDRDFSTQMRQDYTPKPIHICPATQLPPAPPSSDPAWTADHVLYDRRAHAWAS